MTPPSPSSQSLLWFARLAGPLLSLLVYFLLWRYAGVNHAACATAAVGTLLAVWWMTEALPLPVTSLLPLALFPLAGVLTLDKAAEPYANKYIFLYLGGFMVALAVERWNLHRRIALVTVLAVGTSPARLIGGFMLATAFLSMWMSNTATAVLMLPIGLSLVRLLTEQLKASPVGWSGAPSADSASRGDGQDCPSYVSTTSSLPPTEHGSVLPGQDPAKAFAVCMMLGIAYASSLGGLATLVGTPTNLALAGFAKERGITIGFGSWSAVALPTAAVYLVCTWLVLTKIVFPIRLAKLPGGRDLIRAELAKLGPLSRGEAIVLAVFSLTALAWITREPLTQWTWLTDHLPLVKNLDDTIIVLIAVFALFLIPVDWKNGIFALDWPTAEKLPWGVLLLFGGGLSLAAAVQASGLAKWIGEQAAQEWLSPLAMVIVVTAVIIFLTELTSNTAVLTTFLPVLYSVAVGLKIDPLLLLIPATMAASCAFMLPAGTPPNAIVFGAGHVSIRQMCRGGCWLNLLGVALIPLATYTLGKWVFGLK